MLLGLSKIIDSPGASVSFSTSVDLSDLCYGVSYPVSEPVLAQGTVRNTAGVLVTEIADEENEDEWIFPLEADAADLDDIVRTVFVLNLDSKLLCREDCRGLCHRCGKNLNDGPCSCRKELDPRFAALKQLLEK